MRRSFNKHVSFFFLAMMALALAENAVHSLFHALEHEALTHQHQHFHDGHYHEYPADLTLPSDLQVEDNQEESCLRCDQFIAHQVWCGMELNYDLPEFLVGAESIPPAPAIVPLSVVQPSLRGPPTC
jgi:hypothetical protein